MPLALRLKLSPLVRKGGSYHSFVNCTQFRHSEPSVSLPTVWQLLAASTCPLQKYPNDLAPRFANSGGDCDVLAPSHPDTFGMDKCRTHWREYAACTATTARPTSRISPNLPNVNVIANANDQCPTPQLVQPFQDRIGVPGTPQSTGS